MRKLSVSNLAWASTDDEQVFKKLNELNITGVEIAPTKVFGLWERDLSLNSLDNAVRANRLSNSQLSELLNVELSLVRQLGDDIEFSTNNRPRNQNWGDFAFESSTELNGIPQFENVIEFDPKESIYINGEWSRPNY